MGKKLNSNPHPLAPWGRFLVFFRFFSKNLKVTLQKRVPENFRSCRWGAEQRVSRAQTRGPGSEDPHRREQNINSSFQQESKI